VKIVITIVAVLLGLLSIAAGFAKVTLIPEELAFLGQFGFSTALTVSFGAVQILGGLLLMLPKARFYGSLIVGIAFALSVVLLLVAGDLSFAAVSLAPLILTGLIAYQSFSADLRQ
jgi:hypothetical protein